MRKTLRFSALALILCFLFTLVACAPKNVYQAEEKMEKKGYEVVKTDEGVIATKEGEYLAAEYVEDKEEREESYEEAVEALDKIKAAALLMGISKEEAEDIKVVKIGKWVVVATKKALKDFK